MKKEEFYKIYMAVVEAGYQDEIDWSENLKACDEPELFLNEYIWVVLNSGMKNQVARKIYQRIRKAFDNKEPIKHVFNHKRKVKAISKMASAYKEVFNKYQQAKDKLKFCEGLPYIGKVTKYHLAKNLGVDICKPDRHLNRIAARHDMTPQELCERLSKETGFRISTIDIVLWRAANLGLIKNEDSPV